jgi:hypothetical protein
MITAQRRIIIVMIKMNNMTAILLSGDSNPKYVINCHTVTCSRLSLKLLTRNKPKGVDVLHRCRRDNHDLCPCP